MTTEERDAKIYSARQRGISYAQIAKDYDIPLGTAYRVVHYQRKKAKPEIQPTHQIKRHENERTDIARWHDGMAAIRRRTSYATVMHLSDIHFPFHDEQALALTYAVVKHAQPDIIVVGSDAFDLPTISRFDADHDLNVDDWLDQIAPYWSTFIDNLRKAAPNALLPFIVGNHDARALAEIKKLSVPRVVMNHFIDTVQCDGEVMWLGDTGEIDIGNLTVAHGFKTTRHTAAATLQAYQHQRNIAVGHTHRPDYYTVRGAAYSVACVVGGCLCQLTPHYQQGRKHTDWQHGTMLGVVSLDGKASELSSLRYHDDGGAMWTSIGTQVIRSS